MNQTSYLALGLLLGGLLGAAVPLTAPPNLNAVAGPRSDHLDLVVRDGGNLERVRVRVTVDGRNVVDLWDEAFARLFAYYDADGDGRLDAKEVNRLPGPLFFRQLLWGQFNAAPDRAPPLGELDRDGDGGVSSRELADYYRSAGPGGVTVAAGFPDNDRKLGNALLRHLDTNGDGKVTEAEWRAAAVTLAKLDKNDDELIGPAELVPGLAYPGAIGNTPVGDTERPDRPTRASRLPITVLPRAGADAVWQRLLTTRGRRPGAADGPADKVPPHREIVVRLGKRTATAQVVEMRLGDNSVPATAGGCEFALGSLRFVLRADEGVLPGLNRAAREGAFARFAAADANGDGKLERSETRGSAKAADLAMLIETQDRDGDGCLSREELAAWFDLRDDLSRGQVLLTVLDHGRGLFEFLDADHDGTLSVRELRSAWQRLSDADLVRDGVVELSRLPRQFALTVSRGHPTTPIVPPDHGGQAWFRAMDRNGDGDISAREWVGDLELFRKLDADHDGLLSVREAERIPHR